MASPSFCLWNVATKTESSILIPNSATALWPINFVVWTPNKIFAEEIDYKQQFVKVAVSKAQKFYFDIYLPSIIPYFLIHDSDVQISDPLSVFAMTESTEIENLIV